MHLIRSSCGVLSRRCGVAGLVDTAEMGELIYLVERQKKRLHFGAPTLRVPPLNKELWQHPLLKGLTAQERAQVSIIPVTRCHYGAAFYLFKLLVC